MTLLSFAELESGLVNIADAQFKTAGEFLLSALNDWPKFNLKEPAELLTELKREVPGRLTYGNLERFYKSLANFKNDGDAHKAESMVALLELFDFSQNKSFDMSIELDQILEKITRHFRSS